MTHTTVFLIAVNSQRSVIYTTQLYTESDILKNNSARKLIKNLWYKHFKKLTETKAKVHHVNNQKYYSVSHHRFLNWVNSSNYSWKRKIEKYISIWFCIKIINNLQRWYRRQNVCAAQDWPQFCPLCHLWSSEHIPDLPWAQNQRKTLNTTWLVPQTKKTPRNKIRQRDVILQHIFYFSIQRKLGNIPIFVLYLLKLTFVSREK